MTSRSLLGDYRQQGLVNAPQHNIGDQAYCLSKQFNEAHPEVEWGDIAELRHRLVHDCEGTNWRLDAIVFTELPELVMQVKRLLREQG